jgi:hypothetical protein
MRKEKAFFFIIILSLSFLFIGDILLILSEGKEYFKYIRFLTPISISILLLNKKSYSGDFFKYIKFLFLFFLGVSLLTFFSNTSLFSTGFTYRNFVNILLLLLPIYYFFVIAKTISRESLTKMIEKIISIIFISFSLIYFIELISKGVSITSIISSLGSNILIESGRDSESGKSLVFGFFALFFLSKKQYKLFIFAVLLTIIGGKRIAIGGLFIASIVFLLLNNKETVMNLLTKKTFLLITVFLSLILVNFWLLVYSGEYDAFIYEITGLSTNTFLMGRVSIISSFFDNLADKSNYFLGYGIGYVENVLYYKNNTQTAFHNDFLRLYLELGVILFSIWILTMIKYCFKRPLTSACLILLLIIIQTDNALIYESVMYSFYFILLYSSVSDNKIKSY